MLAQNTSSDVPNFLFFSQVDLLRGLLTALHIDDVNMDDLCSFGEFCKNRSTTSYTRSAVEEKLTENEIGGVILGSLRSGINTQPLDRDEYLEEKRSNVTNKTERGRYTRNAVYNEFEKYQTWKNLEGKSDINDVVLRILKDSNLSQIFDSAYVDEVQDFSYASLLLMCSIGGRLGLKWIFAGDTAQMVSSCVHLYTYLDCFR